MKTPENLKPGNTGERNAGEIFSRLPLKTQITLSYLFNEVSSWLPRLKPIDAWRPLIAGILALQMAACKPTRGSEYLTPPSPTPIVELYHPQTTLELTPTPTHETTSMATPGPTISGEILAIGGSQLELNEFDGEEIAQLINASEKGWQLITNNEGKVSFFSGYVGEAGKESQVVVLAQGPEDYQWNPDNQIWQKDNQVVIPDVLLPGGWNEEKQMAGPAHEADTVFLFKDESGNYRIGIIYSSEKVAQIPDKSNLEIFPDGSGLYVGLPKNYELQEGQQIIRDEDGNLRLTNADSSYLLMRTSWSQVTSPNQLYQAGAFAGPFETQPTLPYPTDEIVQELGINNYQVVDNHYIAFREVVDQQTGETHQYIIAQVITNKEGEFTGWQKTIPFAVETGLAVPHPQETNPELFDLKKSDAPIPQFVNAMSMGGIEVRPEEILANITYEHRQYSVLDEQGKPVMKEYVFAVWNLPEEILPEKYKTLKGVIPLFWAKKEVNGWQWQDTSEVPFRIFADALGIYIGNNDEALHRSLGSKVLSHFNLLRPSWSFVWERNQPNKSSRNSINTKDIFVAKRNKMEILGGPIIHKSPQWVVEGGFTNQELEDIIRQRVREVMKSQPSIKYWIVTNEVGSAWRRNDPLTKRLGAYKLLEIAYSEARATNPNAVLIFSDSVNHFFPRNGGYSELPKDLKMLQYLKDKGLVDAVDLHMHLNKNQWSPMPTEEEFQRALEAYKKLGINTYITEMDVSLYNYPPEQKERFLLQAIVYKNFIRRYLESGTGGEKPIVSFWGLRDNESWLETWGDEKNPNADPLLFDDAGRPKLAYYAILSLLYYLANQGRVLTP